MPSIRALSIAPAAREWLAQTRQARVLHVFDRACNLINDRGQVLSVVVPAIGNGPFNVVVERDEIRFQAGVDSRSSVSIFPTRMVLGNMVINTGQAKVWSSQPEWRQLHSRRELIALQLLDLDDWIQRRAQPASLFQSMRTGKAERSDLLEATAYATAVGDLEMCRAAARHLSGLGQGLTPAGDDFMLGAMHAAWIMHPIETARRISEALAGAAFPLTTSLSAAWLMAAARGEAGAVWHDLFAALSRGEPPLTRNTIDRLLSGGYTSGADALSGFFGACRSVSNIGMKRVLPEYSR
jgi:hypothetical protein